MNIRQLANNPKFWLGLLVFLLLVLLAIHYQHRQQPSQEKILPVVLKSVTSQNVPVFISAIGNAVATYTVTVKTQINGLLLKVNYKEGQFVKKGDLLAEIDERPLQAQLTQYQGQLMRDEALLANALIDLARYQRLWKQDSISEQTYATQQSLVKQYQGAVEIDKGLIEATKVNLIYCRISSPMDGRVGLRLVDPGNFVQTSDTSGLLVITSLNPITVIFTIPEDDVPKIAPMAFKAKDMVVQAYDRRQKNLLAKGRLLTLDNQINLTTGTLRLRAVFENKENKLFSNQFVNIKLLVTTLKNASTVDTAAIQHSEQGDFVYLYGRDARVSVRKVTTGVAFGDSTVIMSGLTPGQQVVVEGADKLVNGAKVKAGVTKGSIVLLSGDPRRYSG